MKWEYIKFEIRNFTKHSSKKLAQNNKQEQMQLQKDLKLLRKESKYINWKQ